MNDKLFFNAGFGIANGSSVNNWNDGSSSITDEIKTNGFGLNIGAGLSLMWGERVAIEPAFLISSSSSSMEEKNPVYICRCFCGRTIFINTMLYSFQWKCYFLYFWGCILFLFYRTLYVIIYSTTNMEYSWIMANTG